MSEGGRLLPAHAAMTTTSIKAPAQILSFGPFRLDLERRELIQNGTPLHIRAREFDILLTLIERAPDFVSKEELTERVWPSTTVSEVNLRVQVGALRRILGDGVNNAKYILSVTGRGYAFCAPVAVESQQPEETAIAAEAAPPASGPRRGALPLRVKETLGRSEETHRLINNLPLQRIISVVGPGGIGKTTLALTVAEDVADAYDDGIVFVNLAGLTDPSLVCGTIMSALNLPIKSQALEADLVSYVQDKQLLFFIDNCEHVIEAAAALIETLVLTTRSIHFLVTSREPLRIDNEWIFRLGPLDLPPARPDLTAEEARIYPAVRLFTERARLNDQQFELTDDNAFVVADLCRRLDGNPLAVELAAARVALFGLDGLSTRLNQNFNLLTQGRRTALPRHQTLRATLDWSYDILTDVEKKVLYRLSVFRGHFTLTSALSVAACTAVGPEDVLGAMSDLRAKSLIDVDLTQQPERYRLLFLTRDYAREKLEDSGEKTEVHARHAEAYLNLLRASDTHERDHHALEWIDDIRAAIDWAFSPEGQPTLGADLTFASIDMGMRLSLVAEYNAKIDRALERVATLDPPEPMLHLRLILEKSYVVRHTLGESEVLRTLGHTAMNIARALPPSAETDSGLLEIHLCLFAICFGNGDAHGAFEASESVMKVFRESLNPAPMAIIAERMSAQANHFLGNHEKALSLTRKVLAYPESAVRSRLYVGGDRNNPLITARIFKARSLWMTGFPEAATSVIGQAAQMAETHGVEFCYALGLGAIPIALWRGDMTAARVLTQKLADQADEFGLNYWREWATRFQIAFAVVDGDFPERDSPGSAIARLKGTPLHLDLLATFHPRFADAPVFARARSEAAPWCAPEVLRAYTDQGLASGELSPAAAEETLLDALNLAEHQGALGWRLRIATTLARLRRHGPFQHEAMTLLHDLIGQFTEGLADGDLKAANKVLRELSGAEECRPAEVSYRRVATNGIGQVPGK